MMQRRIKSWQLYQKILAPYTSQIFELIDSVFSAEALASIISDGRKPKTNPLNDNFKKKEFKELWSRINQKAFYKVDFNSNELVENCVTILNKDLKVTPLQYTVKSGTQADALTAEQIKSGSSFNASDTRTEYGRSAFSRVPYDLLHEISENTQLTRKTIARILVGIKETEFAKFKENPEGFISEATRLIKEQKATIIIQKLTYDALEERYDTSIFTAAQTGNDFSRATDKLKKHVFDYAIVDGGVERKFVKDLDVSSEVIVYAKLPRGFLIPTPIGDYNPDWAISFKEGKIKYIYFIAETKGNMSSLALRGTEDFKIQCARKFFANLSKKDANLKYDVVDSFEKLMDVVKGSDTSSEENKQSA